MEHKLNKKRIIHETKFFCKLLSIGIPMFETFGLLMLTWFTAFFGPYMAVVVTINEYGEAIPELILWFIITPVCIYGAYLNVVDIARKDLQERHRYKYMRNEYL